MYTPTVLETTTEARDALTGLYESLRTPQGRLDLGLFSNEPSPLLLVKGPLHSQQWLVAGDGTITVIHYGSTDTYDMDATRRMDHPNPIGLFLAAAGVATTQGLEQTGPTDTMDIFDMATPTWGIKAASAGTQGVKAEPIAQEDAQDLLGAFLAAWIEGMDDPFFRPTDSDTSWSQEDARSVEATVETLLVAAGLEEGIYRVEGQEDTASPIVVDEMGNMCAKLDGITAILALLFPESSFQGTEWEYNDGASDRASGYDSRAPLVCEMEHHQPSAHDQLAAQAQAHVLVAQGGPEAVAIWTGITGR
jgi:hypothetical protein